MEGSLWVAGIRDTRPARVRPDGGHCGEHQVCFVGRFACQFDNCPIRAVREEFGGLSKLTGKRSPIHEFSVKIGMIGPPTASRSVTPR